MSINCLHLNLNHLQLGLFKHQVHQLNLLSEVICTSSWPQMNKYINTFHYINFNTMSGIDISISLFYTDLFIQFLHFYLIYFIFLSLFIKLLQVDRYLPLNPQMIFFHVSLIYNQIIMANHPVKACVTIHCNWIAVFYRDEHLSRLLQTDDIYKNDSSHKISMFCLKSFI